MGCCVIYSIMDCYFWMGKNDLGVITLSFNVGWLCKECGPVAESKKRSINKAQWDCCKDCGGIVTKWERTLNERSGRCGNCAGGTFKLAIHKGQLLRRCETCGEVVNTDQDCKITRKGDKKHEYKPGK